MRRARAFAVPRSCIPSGRAPSVLAAAALVALCTVARAADDTTWDVPVQRGDTLIGITARLLAPGSDWRVLQRVNRVRDPRRLPIGRVLHIPVALLREQAETAEVLHAHGDVQVEHAGSAERALAGGDHLAAGDTVTTGAQSSATLRFVDGSRLLVRPASRLRIEHTGRLGANTHIRTQLGLEAGAADSQVPRAGDGVTHRFELRTPVVNLGVRGTEFRVFAEAVRTRVEVLEGVVGMSSGAARAALAAGQGAWAAAGELTAPRPLLSPPALDALPARVERLPLAFGWPAQGTAARYRAQLFDAAGRLVLDGLFDAPLVRWTDDVPDGRYLLRVRSADAAGFEGPDATAAVELAARPEPPLVTAPRAGERLTEAEVAFEWTRNPAAARYRLQVADSPDFAAPRIDRADLDATHVALALPPGRHHWRLASLGADGHAGPWGDVQWFERVVPPPAPPALSPEPPRHTDDGVELRWAALPVPGLHYHVQVARDAGFAELVVDADTDTHHWLLQQPASGVYYVRVRSMQADGFAGPYGAAQQFEVTSDMRGWLILLPILLWLL